jgi:hypothetical protein
MWIIRIMPDMSDNQILFAMWNLFIVIEYCQNAKIIELWALLRISKPNIKFILLLKSKTPKFWDRIVLKIYLLSIAMLFWKCSTFCGFGGEGGGDVGVKKSICETTPLIFLFLTEKPKISIQILFYCKKDSKICNFVANMY